jgi:hypothetical protein
MKSNCRTWNISTSSVALQNMMQKSRIATAKAAFNKKKAVFTSRLDLNVRNKPVTCYICSVALCGAETWTLRKVDQKYLESSEMWCWGRMEKISWTDSVRNVKYYTESRGREISYIQ